MRICFPVEKNNQLESLVFGHFGSAPGFVVVDVRSGDLSFIDNCDKTHQHGACNPLAGLAGNKVDAVVVGGIGGGALQKLNQAGIRVFQAQKGTIAENLDILETAGLPEYMPGHTCGGHGHGHGGSCSHSH